jgi:hypothetical protein
MAGPLAGQVTPITGWENQLFPSYLISTATLKIAEPPADQHLLGDPFGVLGVEIEAPADNTPVTVTISCDEYLEPSAFAGVLPSQGQKYTILPKVKFRFEKLSKSRQATPTTITYRVQLGSDPVTETSQTLTIRSINDCAFHLQQGQQDIDMSLNFTAYVNEQHPFVDKLLREALDLGVVDSFTGYQGKSAESVICQVYALWDLMVARDLRYSSITATAAASDSVGSQHVRLLEETINNTQANCVDGSVLFASLLRKIGIDSALIVQPEHCYMGFWADEENTIFFALETTLLGVTAETPDEVPEELENAVDEELRRSESWPSFVQAVAEGTSTFITDAEKFQTNPDYQIIDLATARQAGFLPIPYHGTEDFVAFDFTDYLEENQNQGLYESDDWSDLSEETEDEDSDDSEEVSEDEDEDEDEDEEDDEDDEEDEEDDDIADGDDE